MTDYDYDEYDEENWDDVDDYENWLSNGYGDEGVTYAYEADEIDMPDEYYEMWNPDINPPAWYECRVCNGMGCDPYSMTCGGCEGTGIRYQSVDIILTIWDKLKTFVNSFHRCRECGRFFRSEYGDPSLCDSCDSFPF